jgi:hypothetical protein
MFFVIISVAPYLQSLPTIQKLGAGAIAFVTSLGAYKLAATSLLGVYKASRTVRRLVLGKSYLEGTWVGHYERNGVHRITVEWIDQSSGDTTISGRGMDTKGTTKETWTSDAVTVDAARMKLTYAYNCEIFDRRQPQQGLGVFHIRFESAGSPANVLDGYAADLIDGDKDPNREIKISDRPVSDAVALEKALKLFGLP